MSVDVSIPSRWVSYSRITKDGPGLRETSVRVFRITQERVTLQLRNEKHYMTASLDAEQTIMLITGLQANLKEIDDAEPQS